MEIFAQFAVNGLISGMFYALLAIGLTMVFGLMNVVNFAHGEFFVLGGILAYVGSNLLGIGYVPSLFAVFACMFAFGVVFDRLLLAPIRDKGILSTTLVTIGATILIGNTVLMVFGTEPQRIATAFSPKPILIGTLVLTEARLFAAATALAIIVACHLALNHTPAGKALRATFQDPVAARLAGIEVDRIYSWTFGIGAGLAGVAGALLGSIFNVDINAANLATLKAFCVVILGGLGSFPGAILGGLALGLVESLWGGYVSIGFMDAVGFVLIILILVFRPNGLLGKA